MKYTIEGYSQKQLVGMGLDGHDAILLRWFMDFFVGSMEKKIVGGVQYGWVAYQHVIEELPILQVETKDGIYRRFLKLCDSGALLHHYDTVTKRAFFAPRGVVMQALAIEVDIGLKTEQPRMGNRATSDEKSDYSSIRDSSSKIIREPVETSDAVPRGSEEAKKAFEGILGALPSGGGVII